MTSIMNLAVRLSGYAALFTFTIQVLRDAEPLEVLGGTFSSALWAVFVSPAINRLTQRGGGEISTAPKDTEPRLPAPSQSQT